MKDKATWQVAHNSTDKRVIPRIFNFCDIFGERKREGEGEMEMVKTHGTIADEQLAYMHDGLGKSPWITRKYRTLPSMESSSSRGFPSEEFALSFTQDVFSQGACGQKLFNVTWFSFP